MPFVILPTNSASGGYDITNSLRFNTVSSDYLNRTLSTTTNQQIFTWSSWVKRDKLGTGTDQFLFVSDNYNTSSNRFVFEIIFKSTGTEQLVVGLENSVSGTDGNRTTTQVFRDTSAWYHIVVGVDTTQATASNRIKVYVNGSEVTSFASSTNPTQNANVSINQNGSTPAIGAFVLNASPQRFFSGYLAETYLIDGQALTPSSFGETDEDTGIWKPKKYTGTYGTNGFYLQFKNSASLGTDSSGNGNNFTVNNLTSVDQSTDTPTNNFATWNPLYAYGNQSFTEGNLQIATGSSGGSTGTIAVNTGKWYWECKVISTISTARIAGIFQMIGTNTDLGGTGSVYYMADGQKNINGTSSSYGASLTTNDIVGVAIDVDNRSVTYYKNGSSQGSISLTSVFNVGDYITACLVQSGGSSQTVGINFGSPYYSANSYTDGAGYGNFSYAVPSGYYALNTKNLAQFG